jgi:hypothetical protein
VKGNNRREAAKLLRKAVREQAHRIRARHALNGDPRAVVLCVLAKDASEAERIRSDLEMPCSPAPGVLGFTFERREHMSDAFLAAGVRLAPAGPAQITIVAMGHGYIGSFTIDAGDPGCN